MMNVIKFISGCISYFIWHAQNSHQQADQLKQQTQKRLDLICWCATMSTLDDEEAIQGILANVVEEKVTIQKLPTRNAGKESQICFPAGHGTRW
jgi:hypothetical protein